MSADLEPRITMLERLHNDNSVTLKAVQTDFHHMTKTLDKIEVTLSKFADVFAKVDNMENSIARCHARIDTIEIKTNNTSTDFTTCKATKLDRKDIKVLEEKLQAIETYQASQSWRGKIFDRVFFSLLSAIGAGILVYIKF